MKNKTFCRSLLLVVVLLFAFQTTCLAVNHINATFEGIESPPTYYVPPEFVPGQVVPTAPNRTDRPCYLGKTDGFTVENSGTVTGPALTTGNFMRVQDTDDYAAYGADFDFYDRAFNSGCVRVSWDVLFESYEEFYFYFRNGRGNDSLHPAKSKVADIYTWSDGSMAFESRGERFFTTTYKTGVPIHFDCYFDLDGNRWAVVVNGEVLFNNAVIDDYPLGLFVPGYRHDSNLTGAMQVDNIEMYPADSCDWPEMDEAPDVVVKGINIDGGLHIEVANIGSGDIPANAPGDLYIWIDGELKWTYSWATWSDQSFRAAGGSQIINPQALSGDHSVKACMDYNDQLLESNETNNCLEINSRCPGNLPDPQLVLTGTENVMVNGVQRLHYLLSVTNRDSYPESLFAPSPDLPPCGLNTASSRTWVDIYDQDDQRVYGFCALGSPENLNNLWFDAAMVSDTTTAVRVVLNDRLCDREYRSNLVPITSSGSGDCNLHAYPENPLPAKLFSSVISPPSPQPDPAAVQVEVGAAPGVMITPTIQVPAADIGNSGQLLLYIYMPSVNFGINIPGRTVTLASEQLVDLIPGPLDFTDYQGLDFIVYYGYVNAAGTIMFNAYTVTVIDCPALPACAGLNQMDCEAVNNCVWSAFPTPVCKIDCHQFGDQESCANAFDGDTCKWLTTAFGDICENK